MYADDLLLISSTCSDLRRMLRTLFSKPTVYNTVTFNTAVLFRCRCTAHPYRDWCSARNKLLLAPLFIIGLFYYSPSHSLISRAPCDRETSSRRASKSSRCKRSSCPLVATLSCDEPVSGRLSGAAVIRRCRTMTPAVAAATSSSTSPTRRPARSIIHTPGCHGDVKRQVGYIMSCRKERKEGEATALTMQLTHARSDRNLLQDEARRAASRLLATSRWNSQPNKLCYQSSVAVVRAWSKTNHIRVHGRLKNAQERLESARTNPLRITCCILQWDNY